MIRSFIAVPRIILNDGNCSSTDKLVFGIINSLLSDKEYCYTSNKYFQNVLGVGTKTISNSLSRLKKEKYITIKYVDGNRRVYLNLDMVEKNNSIDIENNYYDDIEKNFYHNRISNNIKENKKNNNCIFKTDIDGVEVWNGVRCERHIPTDTEKIELDELLKEFN